MMGARLSSLLENEDERLAGKSAKDHYFKLYKLTFKEWEEINNLNGTLKYSLELTKQMAGTAQNWRWYCTSTPGCHQQARDVYLKSLQPETPPVNPQSNANGEAANLPFDSDGDEFNFYPQDSQAIEVNTELERYNNRNFPLDKKRCLLENSLTILIRWLFKP
ncbi:hypothetical protein KEM48_009235 [Puccinia striiformis f. sp. tritici PST-130]|nr:hypothetical protein KEM48_009235 [Puccinia striiformis f. sp. tritici PST-130]